MISILSDCIFSLQNRALQTCKIIASIIWRNKSIKPITICDSINCFTNSSRIKILFWLNFVQEVLFLIYYQFSTSTDYNSNINLFVGFFNKFRRHDDEYDFAIKVQVELMETNFYSKALTRASQTSTSIWASALATSSPAEEAADWAAVNACLAALMSKLSSL